MAKDRFKLIPAVYLVLQKGNEVLLSERANTGYQDGKYSLVAGHMDGNELATSAMVREASEEAGIQVNPKDLHLCHIAHRVNRDHPGEERMDLFFRCDAWQGEIVNKEPEKCADLHWYDMNHLPTNMLPFIRRVLSDISRNSTYSEYLFEPTDDDALH
jgi:8-oxo-dGTP pyrophosphatase MutT (NUDIX family)